MSNWFTDFTGSAGTGIGDLLGGVVTPTKNLLGENTVTETNRPDAASQSSAKTATVVISILAVITLIVIGVLIFKSSAKTA